MALSAQVKKLSQDLRRRRRWQSQANESASIAEDRHGIVGIPIVKMSNSALEKLLPAMDPLPVPVKMKVTGSALAVWANKMALAKKHTLVRTDFLAVEGIMVFSILVRKFVLLEIPGAIDYVRFSGGSNSYSGFFQVDQAKNALLNARTALPRNRAHRKNPGKSVSAAQKMHTSM